VLAKGKAAVIGGVQGAIGFGIGSIQSSITTANTTSVSAGTQLTYALMGTVMDLVLPKIDIQIGDLSLKLNFAIMMGTSTGFGLQASVSYDDGEFYFGVGYGISYYSNYNGMGINGWEHRASGMAGFGRVSDFRLSLGTNLWWGMKGLDNESLNQQSGILSIKSGDFGMTYENDGAPFGGWVGDNHDRYRTAALNLSIGNYSIGANIFTGARYSSSYEENGGNETETMSGRTIYGGFFGKLKRVLKQFPQADDGGFGARHPLGAVEEHGRAYRFASLYVGYKGLKLGIDSYRHVGHPIQNIFAHYILSPQPAFMNYSNSITKYFQYATPNIFSLW